MFTGLVETLGNVVEVIEQPPGRRLRIDCGFVAEEGAIGDSICINGCCLTVVAIDQRVLDFEAGAETLSRTNLGHVSTGSSVNLERALRAGDRLGGHYVTGHVDALGTLERREEDPPWSKLWFKVPVEQSRQMASKGSVAVDGVSLTLVDVVEDGFSVALIPHTLSATTLGRLQPGDPVNIETDVLAKYVQRQLETRNVWLKDKLPAS
ncbi:MAG: riboflavin synthase [Pirellulaceae bacterium]